MNRRLGSFEHFLALLGQLSPFAIVGVLRLRNGPEPVVVRRALDALQRRQPLLWVRVVKRGGRFYFDSLPDAPEIPLQLVERADEAQWRETAIQALNKAIDLETGPLLRCIYFYQEGAGAASELLFVFHHTIMDATSVLGLYHELLSVCAGEIEEEDLRPLTMLPAAEKLYPPGKRGMGSLLSYLLRQMADEVGYRRKLGGGRRPPILASGRSQILTRRLDKERTKALAQRARRRRLSMDTVLSAAMLLAVHQHLYQKKEMPLRAMMFADLRPYLRPPVAADYLGSYIAMLRQTVDMAPEAALWSTAQALQEKVTASGRRGEKFPAAILSKQLIQMLIRFEPFRAATIGVSYSGVVKLMPSYGEIQVKGLHGFISNNRMGPEYNAYAKILFGELCWDFVYLDSDMDGEMAKTIAAEIEGILKDALR